MEKIDILQCVVNNHNRLAQIMVNGDNAILMGDTLKELRILVQELQKDIEAEQEAETKKEKRDADTDK